MSVVLLVPLQNGVAPAVVLGAVPVTVPAASPLNSVPPIPVTSGILAGESTARPCVADVGGGGIAVGRAGVARCRSDGLAMRVGFLRHLLESRQETGQVGFAISVAGADHRRKIIVDGVLHGVEDVLAGSCARVNIENVRLPGHGVGPLQIEVGFDFVPVVKTAATTRDQVEDSGRAGKPAAVRKASISLKLNVGLPHHRDRLSGSIEQRRGNKVVDRGKVAGSHEMVARYDAK